MRADQLATLVPFFIRRNGSAFIAVKVAVKQDARTVPAN